MAFDLGRMIASMGQSTKGDGKRQSLGGAFKGADMSGKLSLIGDVLGGDAESLLTRLGGMSEQQSPGAMERLAGVQVPQVQMPQMQAPTEIMGPGQMGGTFLGRRGFRFGRGGY